MNYNHYQNATIVKRVNEAGEKLVKQGFRFVQQVGTVEEFASHFVNREGRILSIGHGGSGLVTVIYGNMSMPSEIIHVWIDHSTAELREVIDEICKEQDTASDIILRELVGAGWCVEKAEISENIPKRLTLRRGRLVLRIVLFTDNFFTVLKDGEDLLETYSFNPNTQAGDFIRYIKSLKVAA